MAQGTCKDGTCPACAAEAHTFRLVDVLPGDHAIAETPDGRTVQISIMLVDAVVGDTVLVQGDEAIAVVNP